MDEENNSKGEFEMDNIPTRTIEARPTYLVPAVDHLQGPNVQMTRASALDRNSSGDHNYLVTDGVVTAGGLVDNGDEETGEDARQMPIKDTNGFVNNGSSLISYTRPENVDNKDFSVSEARSELVNKNVGQKLENQFEDEVDEFD